ncbi:MAG: M42 family metallopeptidase [Clostridiales bacterium]|nr:M42 family metallopeptidase [Clostridiales bacterium]
MIEILQKILAPHGPSGREEPVAKVIQELIKKDVDELSTDVMGNIIAIKKGEQEGKRIMFSAHMDQIGFVVTSIEEEGFLRVMNVGGIDIGVSLGNHVVFDSGVSGVLFSQPVKSAESQRMKHLFIDIGAKDKQEALTMVQVGDMAVYRPDFFRLGEHRVGSPAMDDRCACALLVSFLKNVEKPKHTIIAVFSTQEEVGLRGATTAAYTIQPDIGIALDVTAWGDTPEVKDPAIFLGKGPAVKIMDRSSITHPKVKEALLLAGEKAGVHTQREVLAFGGTDAGAIQASRGAVAVGTVSIPCRYVHSATEVIDMRDMAGAEKLLHAFVQLEELKAL